MSNTYGGRSTVPSSGNGPNQTVYNAHSQATGYSASSGGSYSYEPAASYTYYVRPRVNNPETRCSRLGRTVMLCSTFVSAVCAIIMFYLSAATKNLDYLIILSICLLLIQAATGIFVSFTKNKWILFLFSFYCLFNGLAVGTILFVKGPNEIITPSPPPPPPPVPTPRPNDDSTPTTAPVPTSSTNLATTTFPNNKTTMLTSIQPPTWPPNNTTTSPKVKSTTRRFRTLLADDEEEEDKMDDKYYLFDSRQLRQKTSPAAGTTTTTNSPSNVTTSGTTQTTPPPTMTTTTKTTVAPPVEPEKRMAIVYVVLWFSVGNDLVMSFVAYTLICSIGADPNRQLFSESEIAGSSSSTSSGRSRSLSVRPRQVVSPQPRAQMVSGSNFDAVGSHQQQQQSLSRTGRSGMRGYSPSGRLLPQSGSQVTAATQSMSGRSGASGSQATMMQNRSFLSGASQASSRASRATGASLLSARQRPPPSNAYR